MLVVVIGVPLVVALATERHSGGDGGGDAGDSISGAELARETPRIAREVETVRGLRFKHLPEPEVISVGQLTRLFRRQYDKPRAKADIRESQLLLSALGLLEPGDDLQSSLEGSADTVAGAYDPETKRLYIISGPTLGNRAVAEITLAHELNHALEDQVFGLPDSEDVSGDRALAEQAFVEGSATSLMVAWASRYVDPGELFAATTDPSLLADDGFDDLPKIVGEQLLFAYLRGQKMIDAIRAPVGGSWHLVDIGLRSHLPESTEQVMHPETYLRDETPDRVSIPAPDTPGAGWKPAGTGTFGELQTQELLELDNPKEIAAAAASGWGGDRYEIWTKGDRTVVVIRARWDTPADAEQFRTAARTYLRSAEDGTQADLSGGGNTTVLTVTASQPQAAPQP